MKIRQSMKTALFLLLLLPANVFAIDLPPVDIGLPPEVRMFVDREKCVVETKFHLVVEIENLGHDGVIIPPAFTPPKGLRLGDVKSSTRSEKGHQKLLYHYALVPEKAGEFTFSPMEIKFHYRPGAKEEILKTNAVNIIVGKARFAGMVMKILWLAVFATFVLPCLAYFLYKYKSRKEDGESGVPKEMSREDFLTSLQECRSMMVEGRALDFFIQLSSLSKELGSLATHKEIEGMEEKVRFGGYAPASHEMERFLNDATEAIKAKYPKEERTLEDEGIQLQNVE